VSRRAFTLLELLFAVALVMTVTYLVLAALARLMDANALNTAAQMVDDALGEGRQDAVAQNITVEVRLYAAPNGNGFQELQLYQRNTDGTSTSLAAPVLLPDATTIDATASHSSLVTTNAQTPVADPTDPRLNAQTRCFHFLPTGATDLSPPGPWQLTVRPVTFSDPAHFPTNWACLTLDPLTGRAQVYRP
jgi:uncharacterized protein (TIGR02596 family)